MFSVIQFLDFKDYPVFLQRLRSQRGTVGGVAVSRHTQARRAPNAVSIAHFLGPLSRISLLLYVRERHLAAMTVW